MTLYLSIAPSPVVSMQKNPAQVYRTVAFASQADGASSLNAIKLWGL